MTNGKVANRRKAKVRQYCAVCLVNLLGICMGTTAGWTSPMQPLLTSSENPVGTGPILEETFALLSSVAFIGSGISLVFWGRIADCIGRKLSLLLVAVPYILSWTLILIAQSTEVLMLARFLTGIGVAGSVLIVPIYILEIAQNDLRGVFSSIFGVTINLGMLISFALGSYLGYYVLSLIGLSIPIVFACTFVSFPESPRFFWQKGEKEKAEQSLLWYQGGDYVKMEHILSEYKCIQTTETSSTSFKSLVATRETRKAMFIAISMILSIQGTGMFPILSFSEKVFQMSGSSFTPNLSSIVIALMQLVSSCFCSVLIERTGRKPLFVGGLLTITVSLFTLGTYMYFSTYGTTYNFIPVISLSVHVIAYSLGCGSVLFILLAEIFPSEIRCFASSLMHLLNAALSFISVTYFPAILHLLNPYRCFICYSFCCLAFSLLLYFQMPETKGKSEIEILKILNKERCCKQQTADIIKPISLDNMLQI